MPGPGRWGMGDVTPSTIIQAAVSILVALIAGWLARGNTRINAYLQRKDREAQDEEEREQAERAARLAADTAKEDRLSQGIRDLMDRYQAELKDTKVEMRQQHADHQAEIDALQAKYEALQVKYATLEAKYATLQAEHAQVLAENQGLRARIAELERRASGQAPS